MALRDVIDALSCPTCADRLSLAGRTVRCPHGHAFDVARQGYVNLRTVATRTDPGDVATMVDARAEFLATGHFAPLARLVAERVADHLAPTAGTTPTPGTARTTDTAPTAGTTPTTDTAPTAPTAGRPGTGPTASAGVVAGAGATVSAGIVVDAGAGTGYYLAEVLRGLPGWAGLALDISAPALRRAARAHPAVGAVGCDIWRSLPVRDGVAGAVLNVFAPRNPAEFRRVLADHGILLVVLPTERHLAELVAPLGLVTVEPGKQDRLGEAMADHFTPEGEEELALPLALPTAEAARLVAMGPSARHLSPERIRARVGALPEPVRATAVLRVRSFRPR